MLDVRREWKVARRRRWQGVPVILLFAAGLFWSTFLLLVNALPAWSVPSSLGSGGSAYSILGTVGSGAGSMSAWVDFSQVATILAAMVAVMVVAGAVWFGRRVGSMVPFVGRFFQ